MAGEPFLPADVEIQLAENFPNIKADPELFTQIFQNLIDNAVKFNTSLCKQVEIGWQQARNGHLELFVRDNGIGIDPRYQEQIFHPFERLHTREQYPGHGIGLTLAVKAANKLHERIRVESAPEKGSTFVIALPICQKEKHEWSKKPL